MTNKRQMWSLWTTAKASQSRPSDLVEIEDRLAAYCLDRAVVTFGILVENALAQTVEVGEGERKRHVAKYTIRQLLDPLFRLPAQDERQGQAWDELPTDLEDVFYDEVG